MTFGSIPASQSIPSKPEETLAAPVAAPQEPAQPVSHAADHHAAFKPIPSHVPQPHLAHGHHPSHRRTDSTSSAHANEPPHYRAQAPPTISQAPMIPAMGVSQAGPSPFTPQRPPIKGHGMGPMNPQAQHHGMHPQHPQQQQWAQPYYVPYETSGYYPPQMFQPQMQPFMPQQRQPMPARTFNASAPAFTPQAQGSKRIAIINPETLTEVKPVPAAVPSNDTNKASKNPVVIDIKSPEEEKAIITPPPVKKGIKIVHPDEREREERERKEKEEKERKDKEEKERLEREEKERIEREAKEAEERRVREEQAEKDRIEAEARAEQERKEREERERQEQEERQRKEQEEKERLEKERIEKERVEKERAEAEQKRQQEAQEAERIAREKAEAEKARADKEKADQEAKDKLEAERRIALETEKLAEKVKQEQAAEAAKSESDKKAETAAAATASSESKPAVGLSVDLSRTMSAPTAGSPSARIENFNAVSYPSHIQSPGVSADGQHKFRYERDFLMQFMNVCTDKPDSLPSLEVLGGDGSERGMQSPGGSQRSSRGPLPNGRRPAPPMGSFSLGKIPINGGMPMGMRNPSGDNRMAHRTPSDNNFLPRNNLSRPPSQRGSRGGKRGGGGGGGQGRGGDRGHQEPALTIPLADIVPLEKTENAWTPNVNGQASAAVISGEEPPSPEVVARKVKGLLNKLTLEKFDSISDKVIDIANQSTKEDDGRTLKHCIQIIFEKATDEPNFGGVYAQLCQKMMEKISPDVKDTSVEGSQGGKLFRKYLLHRCQEDFMRGWKDKATAGGVSLNDKDGPDLMSDEYYVMMKAKRQGLGLIHFIGELFKLSMLTEKIMHDCVKKLLANVKDPEEEETEGLCKLMTTVGLQLDRPEAKNHMDIYFVRMQELTKNLKLPSRIRFMVQDVIDLRASKWVNRRAAAGPKKIAAIHEEAARQQEEKEMMRRTASSGGGRGLPNRREQLSRGPSFRGGSGDARHDVGGVPQVGADGWSTVGSGPVMTKKAGDLSSFGNTSRSKVSGLPSLGAGQSVFGSLAKGKRSEKQAATPTEATRPISSTNIFAALEGEAGDRRSSVDAEKPVERKRLQLLPRSAPAPEAESAGAPKKTEEEAKRSIENTLKEYLSLRDMNEMMTSVKELDAVYRPLLVTEFVNQSMEMKQSDVDSIAEVFKKLSGEKVVSSEDFETGFADPLEFLADTAIDVPNAYKYAAQLLEAAGMDASRAAKP
ncbi:hypothetical protein BGZ98_003297 [Dissophora globulifera]|nr:hypothetical protein BGZ98_003297 [Dissophora globulifera]